MSRPYLLAAAELGRVRLKATTCPITASWDAELVPTMARTARRVFEEQVLDTLIAAFLTPTMSDDPTPETSVQPIRQAMRASVDGLHRT